MNMNRSFPGKEHGEISLRIAYAVFENLKATADYVIDLHDGAWTFFFDPGSVIYHTVGGDVEEIQKELARASGIEVIWVTTKALPGAQATLGPAHSHAAEAGIPCVAFEVGGAAGAPQVYEPTVQLRVDATKNVMKHLGMIEGAPPTPKKQYIVVDAWWLMIQHGGLLDLKVKPLDIVSKGDLLAEVRDIFDNEVVDRLVSPLDHALVGGYRANRVVNPGEWAVFIGQLVEELP
jgi:predicted deacylase